ncbi:MAG TPA: helix-turn-helix domain-containing protein, partial [Variovorax sp.]|nr:helix-turn-helix domain-containing protein [Variovorax sp.]
MTDERLAVDRQFANTLARGLDLLLCFRSGERALRTQDFIERTGLDRSTIARLTYTLCQLGYMTHAPYGREYRLGTPVLSLRHPLLASLQLRQQARPLMQALADRFKGAASLGMRDRLHMVNIETCRGVESLTPHSDIGVLLPIMSSSMGRAWLAGVSASERQAALNQLRVREPKAYVAMRARVDDAVRDLRTRGYCVNLAERQPLFYGVAVPLKRPIQGEIFVFNCGLHASMVHEG